MSVQPASTDGTTPAADPAGAPRVLVIGVGNVLRGDDMFGVEVVRRLALLDLPPSVHITETGIAGIALVQELMAGYDAVLIIDAVERKRPPGTLVMLEPRVPDPSEMSEWDRREFFADLHQADPSRGLMLAKAVGCLPPRVLILGCEVGQCDELLTELTPAVENALPTAVDMALQAVHGWLDAEPHPIEVPA